jgi:putative transcriptional regulator
MKNRDIFSELMEGMEEWNAHNSGKKTLRTHHVKAASKIVLTPDELRSIREKLNLSQAVFAGYLHTGQTTYQNWEQGRAKPNAQALLLIRMIACHPETLQRLSQL